MVNTLDAFADNRRRLIAALRDATNFRDAGQAAEALTGSTPFTLGSGRISVRRSWTTIKVHGGVLAHRGLRSLYARHKRELPDQRRTSK
jgi:hypothetical protein